MVVPTKRWKMGRALAPRFAVRVSPPQVAGHPSRRGRVLSLLRSWVLANHPGLAPCYILSSLRGYVLASAFGVQTHVSRRLNCGPHCTQRGRSSTRIRPHACGMFGCRRIRSRAHRRPRSPLLKHSDLPTQALDRLSRNRGIMKSRKVKLALVEHPRTPRHISVPMVRHLFTFDLMQVALTPVVPADIKMAAEESLINRLERLSQGERLTLAHRASGRVAAALLLDPEARVDSCRAGKFPPD